MNLPLPATLRVLLVAADPPSAARAAALLEECSARLRVTRVAVDALGAVDLAGFDATLVAGTPQEVAVCDLVADLLGRGFQGAIVVLGAADPAADSACLEAGVADYLIGERTDAGQLERSLRYVVAHARVRAELQRSNADLERFAAAVSHDLRQPLHLVSGYAELLEACAGAELAPDSLHALRQIQFGAHRMNELIEDLLVYARLGRARRQVGAVDTRFVIELVERELAEPIQRSGAVIQKGMLPVVKGYHALIEQILRNLIGNALKFSGPAAPRIFVGAESSGDDWLFCVRDEGPGVPAAFHAHLFEVFTRGPQRDEVAGTGIGLAICKKAVEDHGGRIWLESPPGCGATFWFTLPRRNGLPRDGQGASAASVG